MLIILKIFTKTIRLATYDVLTGAYNRTSYLQRVRQHHKQNPHWALLSVSLGGAIQKESREPEQELFKRADEALYMSKRQGKDMYTFLQASPTEQQDGVSIHV